MCNPRQRQSLADICYNVHRYIWGCRFRDSQEASAGDLPMISTKQVRLLRIVVASPADVPAERDLVSSVVEELNRGIAADRGLRLEVSRWETDAYPGFHPQGPQGLIDSILDIKDCDILVGVFWKRFGTPTHDSKSGTEHEFRQAYEAWKAKRRPQIMVYFNRKSYAPKSKEETEQSELVQQFKEDFPSEGLWWPYEGQAEFETLFRNHLTQLIRTEFPAGPSAADDQMQILFDRKHPYIYEYHGNGPIPGVVVTLYRIAVENIGSKTIEDLVVQLEATKPVTKSGLPVPLHPMHDESGGLHPGKKRFFDVVQMSSLPGSQIEVYPTAAPVRCAFPRGEYALKLKAYGKDAPPAERSFLASATADGKLLFDLNPLDSASAPSSAPGGTQSPSSPAMGQWGGNLGIDVTRGPRLETGLNIEGGLIAFPPSSQRKAAFSFGFIFVGVMLVIALLLPKPTEFQFFVFRIVLALAAAGVAATIPGFINVDIKPWVRAGGAIAVFVVIYFFSPAKLITEPLLSKHAEEPQLQQQPNRSPSAPSGARVASGMTPAIGILVQRGGQATPSTEFEYISNGLGAQAANIGAKPSKVWFAPSGVTLESKDLPKELTINGNKVRISEFTNTGFTIDDHGVQGIKVSGYLLQGEKGTTPKNTKPPKPDSKPPPTTTTPATRPPPPKMEINAPNGIAIGGGTVTNPTVINFGPPQRQLTDEQVKGLTDFINGLPPFIRITVATVEGNAEAEKYANEFQKVLSELNRQGSPTVIGTLGWTKGTPTGTWVDTHSDGDSIVAYRELLIQKMVSLGLVVKRGHSGWVPEGEMYIIVGEQQ
jgi:hypothetical protein